MTTRLLIFDDRRGRFGPMTDLRPVFDLRTGAITTRQRIEQTFGQTADALWVAEPLIDAMRCRQPDIAINTIETGEWLAINGRWLGTTGAGAINTLEPGDALVTAEGELIAVRVNAATMAELLASTDSDAPPRQLHHITLESHVLPMQQAQGDSPPRVLIDRPWHLLDALESTLLFDLGKLDWPTWDNSDTQHDPPRPLSEGQLENQGNHSIERERDPDNTNAIYDRLSPSEIARAQSSQATHPHRKQITVYGQHPLYIQPDATLHPNVVINTERGPVAIASGAEVHPFAVLQGPCFVGKNSVVQPHTNLRSNTVIGPACKVGGEISFSIIHGYSNKAHAGYLGHSLVGRWVNLGGDTNVSNLKNTYGDVRVQLEKAAPLEQPTTENTRRTFVGPIIGDFVRTAIGTRIPTGACIGTGAMLAVSDFAPKFVDRFAFLTDKNIHTGGDATDMEKFLAMARTIVERRCCGLTPEEEDLLCRTAGVQAKRMRDSA